MSDLIMNVAAGVLSPAFLDGLSAIEYRRAGYDQDDLSCVHQVSVARPCDEGPFLVQRSRMFKAQSALWPKWRVVRGSGTIRDLETGRHGHYGLWLASLSDLLASCRLVALAEDDRVPLTRRTNDGWGGWQYVEVVTQGAA